jgi:hypothetical protein
VKPASCVPLDRADDHVAFRRRTRFTGIDTNIKGAVEYDGMLRYEVKLLPKARPFRKIILPGRAGQRCEISARGRPCPFRNTNAF